MLKNGTVRLRCLNLRQLVRVELLETTGGEGRGDRGGERLTYVMTSFRDSMALSSVILSGLSSDVCFFMSAVVGGGDKEFVRDPE